MAAVKCRRAIAIVVSAVLGSGTPGAAATRGAQTLAPGAIEIGMSGALVAVEGSVRASLAARAGTFIAAGPGRLGFEVEPGWSHVGELDGLDLGGALTWQLATGSSADAFFVAVAGGWREEWLGSFHQARFPLGLNVGCRALFSRRGGIRAEYRYRRLLHDPVAAFSEHQVLVGVSLLFRNDTPTAP